VALRPIGTSAAGRSSIAKLRVDFPADFAEERLHRRGHIGALKEVRQVWEMAFLVQVHDVHAGDVNAGSREDVTCTAASGRCSSFCEDDDFTSVRW